MMMHELMMMRIMMMFRFVHLPKNNRLHLSTSTYSANIFKQLQFLLNHFVVSFV